MVYVFMGAQDGTTPKATPGPRRRWLPQRKDATPGSGSDHVTPPECAGRERRALSSALDLEFRYGGDVSGTCPRFSSPLLLVCGFLNPCHAGNAPCQTPRPHGALSRCLNRGHYAMTDRRMQSCALGQTHHNRPRAYGETDEFPHSPLCRSIHPAIPRGESQPRILPDGAIAFGGTRPIVG